VSVGESLSEIHFLYLPGSFYEQIEGVAMGSPLSPMVVNLYMEHFERRVLDSFPLKPKGWRRYIDDTNFLWPHGRNKLDEFFNHLNHQHVNIKFTMEIEKDNSIMFWMFASPRKEMVPLRTRSTGNLRTLTDIYM
jgi:hypothetical protein